MIHVPERLPRSFFASTGLGAIISTAAFAAAPSSALADHRDWRRDREPERRIDVRVDNRECGPIPVSHVERVWVEPVYRTVCERQWIPAQYRDVTERVWVPDRYECREEKVRYRWYYKTVKHEVLVERAHYENVTRQELVCEGRWENVERQELVCAGHWEEHRVAYESRHEERSSARISFKFPF